MPESLRVESLPRHIFRATEAELYRYPAYLREYRLRKRHIEDIVTSGSSPGNGGEPVDGGPVRVPDLQKAIEKVESSRRLQNLLAKIEPIEEAMGLLKETMPDLWKLVDLKYFKGRGWGEVMADLAICERLFYKKRRMAIERIAPILWGDFGE